MAPTSVVQEVWVWEDSITNNNNNRVGVGGSKVRGIYKDSYWLYFKHIHPPSFQPCFVSILLPLLWTILSISIIVQCTWLIYQRKWWWWQKEGVSVKSDGQLHPRLVKLVENPQLSETLDYVIREGRQVVGQWTPDATTDIMLRGPLITASHWSVVVTVFQTVK